MNPQRCISSCIDCPNRMEMYHIFKPYGMMVLPESKESFDFHGRWVCTGTDDDKEILCDLPDWCPLPVHTPAKSEQEIRERVLDEFKWMHPLCFGRHEALCDTKCAWVVRKRCIELRKQGEQR